MSFGAPDLARGRRKDWGYRVDSGNVTIAAPNIAQNAMPATWQTVLGAGAITDDCLFIQPRFLANNVSGQARATSVDLGVSYDGGVTFAILCQQLLAGCASGPHGGIQYGFPLRIRSGTIVGARASVNNATVGSLVIRLVGWGAPKYPVKYGTYLRTFGNDLTASSGTSFTPGTSGAKGAWTQIGTTSDPDLWYWQIGFNVNDASMTTGTYLHDLGLGVAAGAGYVVINDQPWQSSSGSEDMGNSLAASECEKHVPAGTPVNVRGAFSAGTNDTGTRACAYAVGF